MDSLETAAHLATLERKYRALRPVLNERTRRLWAATEARALGRGGISLVHRATGIGERAIRNGVKELQSVTADNETDIPTPVAPVEGAIGAHEGCSLPPERIRRPGAGRKSLLSRDPTLLADLEALLDPVTRGDPQSPLRWCCKSLYQIKAALQDRGHSI